MLSIIIYIIIVILLTSFGGNIRNVTSTLQLPSIYPPVYLFGLIWTILFVIFGIFLYHATQSLQVIGIVYFTLVLLWTPLFVNTKSTAVGFYYLLLVVILTIALLVFSIIDSHPYWWLLIPQLLWTSFATVIAFLLYRLN
jgi:tryptophan-rich sensory protein